MKNLLTLVLFVIPLFTFSQKTLQLNLKVGEKFSQSMIVESVVDQDLDMLQHSMVVTIQLNLAYEVIAIEEKAFVLEMQYDKLIMSTKSGDISNEFNSDGDADNIYNSVFKAFCNEKFKLYLNPDGSVNKFSGMNEVYDRILDKFPELSPSMKKSMLDVVKKSYGEEAMRKTIEASMRIFPSEPVSIGDTWKIKSKLDNGQTQISDYTLMGTKDGKTKIKGVSTFNMNMADDVSDVIKSMKLKGTMSQVIYLDPKNGWVLESRAKQIMQGKVVYNKSETLPDGMSGKMYLSSQTTLTTH